MGSAPPGDLVSMVAYLDLAWREAPGNGLISTPVSRQCGGLLLIGKNGRSRCTRRGLGDTQAQQRVGSSARTASSVCFLWRCALLASSPPGPCRLRAGGQHTLSLLNSAGPTNTVEQVFFSVTGGRGPAMDRFASLGSGNGGGG